MGLEGHTHKSSQQTVRDYKYSIYLGFCEKPQDKHEYLMEIYPRPSSWINMRILFEFIFYAYKRKPKGQGLLLDRYNPWRFSLSSLSLFLPLEESRSLSLLCMVDLRSGRRLQSEKEVASASSARVDTSGDRARARLPRRKNPREIRNPTKVKNRSSLIVLIVRLRSQQPIHRNR
jgi:hypothetical protein